MSSYAGNGQYVLEYLHLKAKDQNTDEEVEWNLMPHMLEVSLFESIDGPMSGYIALSETLNINEILPVYGNETIELEFHTAGNEENPIVFSGKVYKVSEKHRMTEHTSGYKISFCSEMTIRSSRTFVQKSFRATSDQIIQRLYNMVRGTSEKPLKAQSTKGIMDYTFGALHPLEAIGTVCKRSVGSDDSVAFYFYETNKEVRFESIQTMYQKDPIANYKNTPSGYYEDVKNRREEQFESIQDISVNEENSFLDRIMDGLHGSNHAYFDLLNKQLTTYSYEKGERFEENKSLGTIPDKKPIERGNDTQSVIYRMDNKELYFVEINGKMKRIESETFKATVSVFGDSNLQAGDILYLVVPNWNRDQENVKTMFQGNVLIDSIRHTITQESYAQSLGVRKDAYEEVL